MALETPVLLLDDLGANRGSDWVEDTITSIITYRCNNKKPLIATTNCPDEDTGSTMIQRDAMNQPQRRPRSLAEQIGPRARSRLFEMCTIVNIGGLSAHTGAKNRAHVVTAKAGIIGFTRALAHDLADDGITVNCVVPGLIGTPRPKDRPEPAHHLTHRTISGHRGLPEDVAATVRFLCGPGARYITGQAIHTNGGAYLGA